MTAVTLTVRPADAAVVVEVTGAPAGAVTVARVDPNGTNLVRLLAGQVPIGGAMTVTDYEPALTGTVRYDVTDSAGAVVSSSTSLAGLVDRPYLHVAVLPQQRYALQSVTGYTGSRETGSTEHKIIDRPDPLYTTGRLRFRKGTLRAYAAVYATAAAIESVCASGEVIQFRQPDHPGLDFYFNADACQVEPDQLTGGGWRWQVTVDYAAVGTPLAPLQGSVGWNFDTLAQFGTFAQAKAAFPTFAAMVVGP